MRVHLIAAVLAFAGLLPCAAATQVRARELVERTIANQHRDDDALVQYERVERRIQYDDNKSVVSDKTYRLVPTGTGRLSLLIKRGDQPVDLNFYRKQLRAWQDILTHAVDPNDPRQRRSESVRREQGRRRADLIDAINRAFVITWDGEEEWNGRTLAKIQLNPNPAFQPTSRAGEMPRHVRATAWVDEQSAQLVRAKADIISEIPVLAGIAGKIESGGYFEIKQSEVSPGVWLPTRIEYSVRGRKFILPFAEHQVHLTTHYRLIGTPLQALREVHNELARGQNYSTDP